MRLGDRFCGARLRRRCGWRRAAARLALRLLLVRLPSRRRVDARDVPVARGGGGRIGALGGSFLRRAAAATAAAGNAPRPAYPCSCYLRICVLSVGVTLGTGLLLGGRWLAGGVRRC